MKFNLTNIYIYIHTYSTNLAGQDKKHLPSSDGKVWNSQLFYIVTTTEQVYFYLYILKSILFRIIPEKTTQLGKWEALFLRRAGTESDHCQVQKREGDSSSQPHYRRQMNQGAYALCMR